MQSGIRPAALRRSMRIPSGLSPVPFRNMNLKAKSAFVGAGLLVAAVALAQFDIGSVIKVVGVGAAVSKFGPQINTAINKLDGHKDAYTATTKVVPILSVALGGRNAIGAAQVMGPANRVKQVTAVAQLDQDILGRQVKIRAMVPVSSKNVVSNIKRVDGVGISGIVDLKL